MALGWDRRGKCHSERDPIWPAPEPALRGVDWAMLTWDQAPQSPKLGHCGQGALGYHCLEVPGYHLGKV